MFPGAGIWGQLTLEKGKANPLQDCGLEDQDKDSDTGLSPFYFHFSCGGTQARL